MLTLPIKKKWFDMILSGEKKEEYREIKPYYTTRFQNLWQGSLIGGKAERVITFRNGYSAQSPSFVATCTLSEGTGNPKWGAEKGKTYYVLRIHRILEVRDGNLKRCPFCGGEAEYTKVGNTHIGIKQATIKCTRCFVQRTQKFRNKSFDFEWIDKTMIDSWNRRSENADRD